MPFFSIVKAQWNCWDKAVPWLAVKLRSMKSICAIILQPSKNWPSWWQVSMYIPSKLVSNLDNWTEFSLRQQGTKEVMLKTNKQKKTGHFSATWLKRNNIYEQGQSPDKKGDLLVNYSLHNSNYKGKPTLLFHFSSNSRWKWLRAR